jgi:hypothetical protein
MSYDLMVFAPEAAPRERAAFLEWFEKESEWSESHSYDDPAVSTPALRAWFLEMIETFPAMNGPFALEDPPEGDALLTDYSVGRSVIYGAFAWSKAELAHDTVFQLAERHGVGFFDASSEKAAAWLPDVSGKLVLAHSA